MDIQRQVSYLTNPLAPRTLEPEMSSRSLVISLFGLLALSTVAWGQGRGMPGGGFIGGGMMGDNMMGSGMMGDNSMGGGMMGGGMRGGGMMGGGMMGGGMMGDSMMNGGIKGAGALSGDGKGEQHGFADQSPDALNPDTLPPSPKIWSVRANLGANGQLGNTNQLSFLGSAQITRKTDDNFLDVSSTWMLSEISRSEAPTGEFPGILANFRDRFPAGNFASSNSSIAQQMGSVYARDEFLSPGRAWSPFLYGLFEFNQSQDPEYRTGAFAGISYAFIDGKEEFLKVRVGVGVVYQAGATVNGCAPEGLLGFSLRYPFWDRQAIFVTTDFFPRLDEWGQFRLRSSAGYEILLDPARRVFLRLGLTEWYDTDPGNGQRNNLWYTSSLGVRF
jgi:hypothetical protein